jgi:DNA-binding NarL/FixJ family response regulator
MKQKPDVLIMDKRIQKKFGIDILQNIRKLTPPPMLIMLTNKVFNRYQQEATDVKADFSLDKFTEWNKIPEILHFSQKRKEMDPVKLFA